MIFRIPKWLMLGVPALATLALYWPVLGTGFVGDDFGMLHAFDGCEGARGVAQCVAQMFVSGVGPPSNQYRPLTMASFALNSELGADPFHWHLVNVLLHAACASLVALLACQLLSDDSPRTRAAALMAGWLFAWFAPAVEATAWISARFDGMALVWMLVAACAFVASRRWRDGYGLLSLAATVLSYMSKESATIGVPLILALAWYKQGRGKGFVRDILAALRAALPWLLIAALYFFFRRYLFGDPFRFFPGSSPLAALFSGEWLANIPTMLDWIAVALPEPVPRSVFAGSGLVLLLCALAAGVAERAKARVLAAIAFAVLAAFALLLPHWQWAGNGEGGRVLLAIGAIALVAAALPLASADRPRGLAWIAAIVLLGSQWMLAQSAVARWVQAGDDTRALSGALARVAAETTPEGYAFVVLPDHVGAIPFGRNAQGGLMLPPVQATSIAPKLIVQTGDELARWPDLFSRDIIGRLRREPVASVAANPLTPKVPPPHALPDRWFCWSPRTHALVPVALGLEPGLANWDVAWRKALAAAGCAD
ncbi:MAG: hypothetical protein ABI569_02405 [Casimicrobiaceae bacterium]